MANAAASKWHNVRVRADGHTFDSKAEHARWQELQLLLQAGLISALVVHPRFLLQEGFRDATGRRHRAIHYEADFQYVEHGRIVIEDVKGKETDVFRLKEKLFRYRYPDLDLRVIYTPGRRGPHPGRRARLPQ